MTASITRTNTSQTNCGGRCDSQLNLEQQGSQLFMGFIFWVVHRTFHNFLYRSFSVPEREREMILINFVQKSVWWMSF